MNLPSRLGTVHIDRLHFYGFFPNWPEQRQFDLWSMLPKHNRRIDSSGDLARFISCLQEITDYLLTSIDIFPQIFDLERAPELFVDRMLQDLGNPFVVTRAA